MSEIATGEVIQRLEQRHAELIEELDALNCRLEEALSTFQKSTQDTSDEHTDQQPQKVDAVQ